MNNESRSPVFARQLESAIGNRRLVEVASGAGISLPTLRAYLSGTSEPKLGNLVNLAEFLQVGLEQLAGLDRDVSIEAKTFGDCFVRLPYLSRECFSPDQIKWHENRESWASQIVFPANWLKESTGVSEVEHLRLLYIEGDSMGSSLRNDNISILKLVNSDRVPKDGIYAIKFSGSLFVRRVQFMPGDTLRVLADNPAYSSFEVPTKALSFGEQCADDSVGIIGRVVFVGHRI